VDSAVGEDGVSAGHVERGGVVGAEGDGGCAAGGGDARGAGKGGNVLEAYLLAKRDGGIVERVGEGVDSGDFAVELVFKVAGVVGLAAVVEGEGGGGVVELGDGCEDSTFAESGAVEAGVVGGGVDEGFEDGSGGAFGHGVVELGDAVVAASDESENLAGVGVERNKRDLGVGDGISALAVLLANHFVDVSHADLDGLGGGALEFGVERGVDAEALVRKALVADALDKLVVNEIDEVGCFAGVDVGRGEAKGLGLGAAGFGGGDGAGLDHGIEDEVAALHGTLGMLVGREVVGPLDHASEESGLGEIELAEVFSEVSLRGFTEAINGEAAALAKVDLVGIHLEDLFLVEAGFELEADDNLAEFAGEALLRREKESACQLLGESRAAAGHVTGDDVHDGALGGAEVINATVAEEITVFDGDDSFDEVRRYFVKRDEAALGTVLIFG